MECPRCGAASASDVSCPQCGVVFAKFKPRPTLPRAARSLPPGPAEPHSSLLLVGGLLLLVGLGVGLLVRRPVSAPSAAPPTTPAIPRDLSRPTGAPSTLAPPAPPLPLEAVQTAGLTPEDRSLALSLSALVNRGEPVSPSQVESAERLYAQHPDDGLRTLLEGVLLRAAGTARTLRRSADAWTFLRRVLSLDASNAQAWEGEVELHLESGDWTSAEAVAREGLVHEPKDPALRKGLGYALFRQDRNPEAAEELRLSLELRDDPDARGTLERIRKGMSDEKGMTEKRIAHFDLRYDGEAHDEVGQEILRSLDHHYATLASLMDHELQTKVPVILFSRERYYDASGAPAWSGGVFSHDDGRIRIPIGGLTSRLTPDMEGVLLHELTHAFIFDRSHGLAPHDVHEGFAQYMEGKRVASLLTPDQMTLLADGRAGGVGGFYLMSLSFVEYLLALRGQGGVNELLKDMGATGSVDEAYRQVYGTDSGGAHKAWADHLRQQYGS
jgi:hypothetical protein